MVPDASSEPPTIPEVVRAIAAPLTIERLAAVATPVVITVFRFVSTVPSVIPLVAGMLSPLCITALRLVLIVAIPVVIIVVTRLVFRSIFDPLGCVKIPASPETVTMSAALVVPVEVMFEVLVSIFAPLG